jgi:antidote-toxin recognition MazE-like antitoxin
VVSSHGLRPRDPRISAHIERQAALIRQHPENDAIDDWIEAVYDWEEFGSPSP